MADEASLFAMYEGLARFAWWRRRIAGARPGEGLALRKRLAGEAADLDRWLLDRVWPAAPPRVLDLGCGFGATALEAARRGARASVGLTSSAYQAARAREQARLLGVDCTFRVQRYDDPIAGTFDLAIAIEALFHARDLSATLGHVAGCLAPGGRLVLVEDMAREGTGDHPAAAALRARWSTPRLHRYGDYVEALDAAGLEIQEEVDLTPQLRLKTTGFAARRRTLGGLRAVSPWGRGVLDAFLGGIAMEELHAAGLLGYSLIVGRSAGQPPR